MTISSQISQKLVPEGDAIYKFGENLLRAFKDHQTYITKRFPPGNHRRVSMPLLEYLSIPDEHQNDIPREILATSQKPGGRQIIALEPHADDVALSVGGTLLNLNRPVCVLTIFSRSHNFHPDLHCYCNGTPGLITNLREAESKAAAVLMGAEHVSLGISEAKWPLQPPDLTRVDDLILMIRSKIAPYRDCELIAPACVSRHPDHVLTRLIAERLGCGWFWEDVDFYVNYARSVEDREYFLHRWSNRLVPEVQGIDHVLLEKLAIVLVYQSQYFPPTALAEVLRYNWAVARESHRHGQCGATVHFAERTYRFN